MKLRQKLNLRRRFSNQSFRTLFRKNFLIVFAGIIIPLFAALLVLFVQSHRLLLQETDNANRRSLENSKATLDTLRSETEYTLNQFLLLDDIQTLLSTPKGEFPNYSYINRANIIQSYLRANYRQYLDYNITIYSDISDYTLSALYGGQTAVVGSQRDLIQRYYLLRQDTPQKERFCVERMVHDFQKFPYHTLTFYRSIPNLRGTTNSFGAVEVDTQRLTDFLTSSSPQTGSLLIVNRQGQLLYHSQNPREGEESHPTTLATLLSDEDIVQDIITQPQGAVTWKDRQQARRISWVPSRYDDWIYVQIIPFDEYSTGILRLRNSLFLLLLPALLVVVGISFSVSSRLFRPLEAILHLVENPQGYDKATGGSGEIGFLLMDILESFQKNITLEEEMLARRATLRAAQAKALQRQIAPHFLYNALQSIHWLSVMETGQDNSKTSQSIITLSQLVRVTMEEKENITTVQREIEYIQQFMEIERLRFGNDIHCHYRVAAETLSYPLLRLTLQPLVENAIRHGLVPNGMQGNVYITIKETDDTHFYLAVEDDGSGMSPADRAAYQDLFEDEFVYMSRHVGLVNLSQRLRLVYGDFYRLHLKASDYGGLKVETNLPKSLNSPTSDQSKR